MPGLIHCRTLGPIDVRLDGDTAPKELLWRKHLALVVYLARSRHRARTREHLVGLLWGEKPEAAARHSLNEVLRIVRRHCGDDAIDATADRVRLSPEAVQLDTDELERRVASGDLHAAADLVAGEFMEGFSISDAPEFEDWLYAERQHWRARSIDTLLGSAATHMRAGVPAEAASRARRALRLDATSDAACRMAMRALAVAGQRAEALALFDSFVARLAEDVGIEPDPETAALAQRVRRERVWRFTDAEIHDAEEKASRRTPLAGRAHELGVLLECWESCHLHRRAAVAIIEGDAGTGKTRLLDELVARARLDGATPFVLRAVESDVSVAGGGIAGLVRLGIASDENALSAALCSAAERQSMLLAFDDAQWLDRETILMLSALLRDARTLPLLVALTFTPAPGRTELDQLRARIGRDFDGATARLGPLAPGDLKELARWALPAYDGDELARVTRRLATDSAGLPLLAVELLHAIALGLDFGAIRGAWPDPLRTLDHTLPAELPDTITAAVRTGFRRLSGHARDVVSAMAVLPERVEASALERATGLALADLGAALDELEWNRWVVAEPRGYSIIARAVRRILARDMVTPGQRRRILESARDDDTSAPRTS